MKPRRATARADAGDPTIPAEAPFRTLDALTRAQTQDQPLDPAASPIARRSA
jgi:ABC-type taurine transport system ATPase subunit